MHHYEAPFARAFARRFSDEEGQELAACFAPLRARLAADEEQALSALRKQGLPTDGQGRTYRADLYSAMPEGYDVPDFVQGWGAGPRL